MSDSPLPPHYILLSQSSIPAPSAPVSTATPTPTLTFPSIHYHYADDPPLSLLPPHDHQEQQYIILDYDPKAPSNLVVRSISDGLAVVAVKVTEAPGIAKGVDDDRNTGMYIIETVSHGSSPTVRSVFL